MTVDLLCPLIMIGNVSGRVGTCETQKCMFWDSEKATCIMRTFFIHIILEERYRPSKDFDNQDVV